MILNQFGNVSVPGKSEIARKLLHGNIVEFSGNFNFRFSGLNRKLKIPRCIISRSTLYTPKVSSKSVKGCPRSYFPHLK